MDSKAIGSRGEVPGLVILDFGGQTLGLQIRQKVRGFCGERGRVLSGVRGFFGEILAVSTERKTAVGSKAVGLIGMLGGDFGGSGSGAYGFEEFPDDDGGCIPRGCLRFSGGGRPKSGGVRVVGGRRRFEGSSFALRGFIRRCVSGDVCIGSSRACTGDSLRSTDGSSSRRVGFLSGGFLIDRLIHRYNRIVGRGLRLRGCLSVGGGSGGSGLGGIGAPPSRRKHF